MISKVYQKLYGKEVFSLRDVEKIIKNYQVAKNTVYKLIKQGYVRRIKKGLYYSIPLEFFGRNYIPDRFVIGSALTQPYFFSHHSSLELHGVAYSSFNTVFISTPNPFKTFEYQGIIYRCVYVKECFGITKIIRSNQTVYVSDKERTILEAIEKLDYVGGIEEMIKSIDMFPFINYDRLYEYLLKFNKKALFHKTGYVLSIFKEKWNLPEDFFEKLKTNLSKRVYYLDKKNGKFVKEWNLMVPKNIKKVIKIE
ncbi:MAG: hypothetical protein ACE5KT_00440 [Methanosarcinales archaeon]